MFRMIRTATVKTASKSGAAMQLAGEITAYLNKTYSLNMKFGMEIFGAGKIHWHLETDSLDKSTAINAKLMQDRDYQALLEKGQGLWLEGSLKDTLVTIVG